MRICAHFLTILVLLVSISGQAATRAFRIFSAKQITSQVERFYGEDGGAFASVFCKADVAQVMMVDSRIRELDGKTFYFPSLEACNEAREQAHELSGKCAIDLVIDTTTMAAGVDASRCQ